MAEITAARPQIITTPHGRSSVRSTHRGAVSVSHNVSRVGGSSARLNASRRTVASLSQDGEQQDQQKLAVRSTQIPANSRQVATRAAPAAEVATEDESKDYDMSPAGEKKRWSMVFALFCAFVLCNLDKVNMSVAIIPMSETFQWTPVQKGLVQSAFFWGYTFTQLPGGWLASKLGGKVVLLGGVLIWSFGTLIAPACAAFSFAALLASRFIVGFGEGVAPPAATGVLARGIPPSQRSKAVTSVFGGLDVGSVLGLLIAPRIILGGGWPAVFYLFGVLGFVWGTWWYFGYMRDDAKEAAAAKAAGTATAVDNTPIPWGPILKNKPIWALMVAHFTWNYFSYGLLAWLPSFLESALGFTLSKSSFFAILPYLSTVIVTIFVGPAADALEKKGILTRTGVRKFSQTLCFLGGAFCLSAIAFIVQTTPPAAVTSTTITLVMGFLSLCFGLGAWVRTGLFCGHQDISPKYASVMLGATNTAAAIGSTVSTFTTGTLLQSTGSWALSLFIPIAVLQVISTIIFMSWNSTPIDFDKQMADEQKAKLA